MIHTILCADLSWSNLMADDDGSLDLTGLGKVAKAIPASSWNKIVKTACETFSQILAPLTSTMAGTGRLIQAKFDGMVDVQQVYAADALKRAKEKVEKSGREPKQKPKSSVLINSITKASVESDDNLRSIWANLIANELLDNRVHPDFPNILERLTSVDAVTLAQIGESSKSDIIKRIAHASLFSLKIIGIYIAPLLEGQITFSEEHLQNLNLIRKYSGLWKLTRTGEEFLKVVSDPSIEYIDIDG